MTIDETIKKYHKLSNPDKTCYQEEAQQIAKWLEELKQYKEAEEQGLLVKIKYHCKDCKHWKDGVAGCTEHVKLCELAGYMVGENGFCLYVESEER